METSFAGTLLFRWTHRLKPTYEEWKRNNVSLVAIRISLFKAYLWGMETTRFYDTGIDSFIV